MEARFSRWSNRIAVLSGHWLTFVLMTAMVLIWALSGPLFGFSQTWQLVINTATTVLTFLMVFLIQNSQNTNSLAVHVKLDELIHAAENADNKVIAVEDESEVKLVELKSRYTDDA